MSATQTNLNRCRICLDPYGGNVLLNSKMDVDEQVIMISDMLVSFTGLHISVDDGKPQTICLQCSTKTYELYQFREICIKTDLILQNELDSQNEFNLQENKFDLHSELDLGMEERMKNLITDDNTNGTMRPIKDELPDFVSTFYNDDHKFEQNTSSMEEIICKICQTYFTNSISLEHHLDYCCRRVGGDSGKTLTNNGAIHENTLIYEETSTSKKVVLKQRKKLESHKCRFCKMSCKFPTELRNHLMTHTTVKHYLCSYCGNNFSLAHRSVCERTHTQHSRKHINIKKENEASESEQTLNHKCLREHERKTPEKLYQCSYCDKRFNYRSHVIRHERIHTGEKPYHCSDCGLRFTQLHHLNSHKLIHNGEKPYECSYCTKRFTHQSHLSKHVYIHTGEKRYQCLHCTKRFKQRSHLTEHKRIHTGEKPYECSHCTKRFTQRSSLIMHNRVHSGEKPYECSHCSKRFNRQGHLKRHERTHSEVKTYVCSHCGKHFAGQDDLSEHERIHTGEKLYECSHCGKCFVHQSFLTEHERIHTGEKPYDCSYCSKSFARQSDLTKHERIHTGEKPYQCLHCSKCFTDKSNFTRHERTHTNVKPYECSHCSKSFARKEALLKHKRIHTVEKSYEFIDCK